MTITQWAPSVDNIEDDKERLVKADLPEVKKEDVKVTVENGVLAITGERKFEKEEKDKTIRCGCDTPSSDTWQQFFLNGLVELSALLHALAP